MHAQMKHITQQIYTCTRFNPFCGRHNHRQHKLFKAGIISGTLASEYVSFVHAWI